MRSFYRRENGTAQLGWTPSEHTWLELTAERSNARAAYADRTMDGPMFDRESFGLKLRQEQISRHWQRSELTLWDNDIDHIMDNFSLRPNSGMKMLSNPDRRNTGGRWANDIALPADWLLTAGLDANRDQHRARSGWTTPASRASAPCASSSRAALPSWAASRALTVTRGVTGRTGSRPPVTVRGSDPLQRYPDPGQRLWPLRIPVVAVLVELPGLGPGETGAGLLGAQQDSVPFTLNPERSRQWDAGWPCAAASWI